MDTFIPNRKLLNPKFQGYKFDFIEQDDVISRFPLQNPASQATTSSKTLLSFPEVQSRISHNHLALTDGSNRAVYVDEYRNLVLIEIAPDTLLPSFRVVYELPKHISTVYDDTHPEYPSAVFLSRELLFISDGHGVLYLLHTDDSGPFSVIAVYQLPGEDIQPFLIHSAEVISPDTGVVILSSRNRKSKPDASTRKPAPADFNIWAVKCDLLAAEDSDTIRPMTILWNRRGDHVPILARYDSSRSAFMLIGGSSYRDTNAVVPPSYEPSPDEIAPVPRQDENLDAPQTDPARPPPYSWTQTSDSVTVAFPLPSNTPKTAISVTFSTSSLTLSITESEQSVPAVIPLPRYTSKAFWDDISPSSSYWTWDREAAHSFGLLTLHLDKQHEGTKWMQVFESAARSAASETSPEDVEVPETLDPSELWHIRESLEKYTAALVSGEDASGLGLGRGVPSLGEGEMDEEVDSSVGRAAYITWVGVEGSSPSWSNPGREYPFTLLSTPLPGVCARNQFSVIVKENLDGTVFVLETASANAGAEKWTHTSTFSALAFVLASKQDVRFTHHNDNLVLAFENGLRDRGGNVYVYRRVGPSDTWAKQAILKVGDGVAGALLGVGAIRVDDRDVILALTERQLVVLKSW